VLVDHQIAAQEQSFSSVELPQSMFTDGCGPFCFLRIFSVDASNCYLGLWCRIQWNVQVFRSSMVKVRCSYIVWFSR